MLAAKEARSQASKKAGKQVKNCMKLCNYGSMKVSYQGARIEASKKERKRKFDNNSVGMQLQNKQKGKSLVYICDRDSESKYIILSRKGTKHTKYSLLIYMTGTSLNYGASMNVLIRKQVQPNKEGVN